MKILEKFKVCSFAESLARDLEMFAHHAGRKTVNADDVLLAGKSASPDHMISNLHSPLSLRSQAL